VKFLILGKPADLKSDSACVDYI